MAEATSATNKPAGGGHIHEVVFYSYPKLLFIWPLILAGFVLWPFAPAAAAHSDQLEVIGWVYITILWLVALTLGVDVNRNQSIFWGVVIFALWILGLYLNEARNIPLFGWVMNWFGSLDVQYSRAMGLAFSIVLSIPYVIMFVYARFNDRWRITHNEFEHYSFGKMDEALGRGAKTIRTEFPDVLEYLLGGAGTLIVYSASGNQQIKKIEHVMMLTLVRKKLNKILETVSITTEGTRNEEEEQAI